MKWLKGLWEGDQNIRRVADESKADLHKNNERREKVEKAAEDFAVRFEDVMKDLARG